ncbi:polysaccharide deacetylase family protein [Luteolibacter flavescens]|uniref:Polysaccharide deacetylase family protein n=1 Tax=Luteolibacter flavescens TaxID=1859460 RepID=A0ABT3FQE1_9BACT|nr:polysaccharide deacetylase family protein [Luteolibacter flavescens]MCW1885782.1 polysaccharide deacetylase family protein [Luteolibacter flavescens]
MRNPIESLGYKILTASSQAASSEEGLPKLSRRGFMVLGTALGSSCSMVSSAKPDAPAAAAPVDPAAAPARTAQNKEYRTPRARGPVPRNPDMSLPAGGASSGVTFSRVAVSQPYIALTFDDGPHPKNTPRLLDMLRERNIKATFYVIGRNVDLYPTVLRRTVSEGHEIGNHTYTHPILSKLSDSAIRQELTKCRDAVARAAGVQPRTMRPPYGALLQRQREWVRSELNYPTIMWSVDPLDWKRPGASVITSRILSGTTPGAIVLAHDLHASTVDAMPATLDGLLNKGFKFVTVSQLLAMGAQSAPGQVAGQ